MDYLQTLFGFFNAPLFATFILDMFWKRMTATAGWTGLVALPRGIGGVRRRHRGQRGGQHGDGTKAGDGVVRIGVLRDTEGDLPRPRQRRKAWFYKPVPLAAVALALTIILNIIFH